MAVLPILQLGNPALREVSAPVISLADALATLVDLKDTLAEFRRTHGFGRGISAIQIGAPQRVIYIEFEGVSYSLINPAFDFRSEETFPMWDDCFSFPDLLVFLERARSVRLRYTDAAGASQLLEASHSLSELLQHEMDHLDGILAVDRALGPNGLCTREEWRRRYATG